jgi:tape measure domain-containing protein
MASGPLTVQLRINADGSAAIVGLRNVQGALDTTGKKGKEASAGINSLSSSLKGLAMTAGAALSVGALAQAFITANLESQRLVKGLTAVAGSATAGAAEMDYISKTADKLGLSLTATGSAYVSLTAATKGTAMEGQATRAIFESISLAMGKLGKSSADTEGALMAIQQMISKGTVSSEELKQQLGERLPGAFRLAAEAIGVTEQQLGKMLEQGQVVATDLLPKLSQKLLKLYDDGTRIGGMGAEWERVKNAANAFFVELDKGTGITGAIATLLSDVASAFKGMTTSLVESAGSTGIFATAMASLGETIKTTRAELISGEWSESTTLIMAVAGAAAGMAAIMVTLSGAIGVVNVAMGILTGILALNPFTAIILAIGATAGALYALSEQTVTVGDTTATVGSMVQAAWEITATNSVAAWEVFTGWIMSAFDNVPAVVSAAGSAIVASWSSAMTGLMQLTSSAVNFIMNSFKTVGTALGVIAGEIAMTFETGFNFERLKQGLADSVSSTDQLGEANNRIQGVIKNTGTAFKAKTQAIESDRLEEQLAGVVTSEHAKQQANLSGKLAGGIAPAKALASAIGAGGAAHKGAAKAANEQEKALDALIAKYLPARDDAKNLKEATAVLDKAMEAGKITGEEYGKMLKGLQKDYDTAANAAQDLIDKYDREGAAARTLKEDSDGLNKIIAEGGPAAERAKVALTELGKQQAKNGKEADAWAEVWKNAVKRIDDSFASLWKDLFTGTKSALESMKNAILSWLAEVAHALLTKPLVVAITTAMTGATGTAGAATNAVSGASNLSGLSNIGSLFSSIYSLGSTFISGLSEGIMGMFSTNMFSTLGTAWGAVTSGSATGAAAGLGVMSAYALPILAIAAPILGKYFQDQKPRYGAYAATTTGRTDQFEDEVGVKGGFGLTFGMNDMGTANVDAEEMRQLFEGFAAVSIALENFYGKDVASQVTESLSKASMENWGKNGLMNYAMNAEQAFQIALLTSSSTPPQRVTRWPSSCPPWWGACKGPWKTWPTRSSAGCWRQRPRWAWPKHSKVRR